LWAGSQAACGRITVSGLPKGKVHSRTGHEGPEGE